jgi:hypothetical protein
MRAASAPDNGEAVIFGKEPHLPHDLRRDRADGFMEIVDGHRNTRARETPMRCDASGLNVLSRDNHPMSISLRLKSAGRPGERSRQHGFGVEIAAWPNSVGPPTTVFQSNDLCP